MTRLTWYVINFCYALCLLLFFYSNYLLCFAGSVGLSFAPSYANWSAAVLPCCAFIVCSRCEISFPAAVSFYSGRRRGQRPYACRLSESAGVHIDWLLTCRRVTASWSSTAIPFAPDFRVLSRLYVVLLLLICSLDFCYTTGGRPFF